MRLSVLDISITHKRIACLLILLTIITVSESCVIGGTQTTSPITKYSSVSATSSTGLSSDASIGVLVGILALIIVVLIVALILVDRWRCPKRPENNPTGVPITSPHSVGSPSNSRPNEAHASGSLPSQSDNTAHNDEVRDGGGVPSNDNEDDQNPHHLSNDEIALTGRTRATPAPIAAVSTPAVSALEKNDRLEYGSSYGWVRFKESKRRPTRKQSDDPVDGNGETSVKTIDDDTGATGGRNSMDSGLYVRGNNCCDDVRDNMEANSRTKNSGHDNAAYEK